MKDAPKIEWVDLPDPVPAMEFSDTDLSDCSEKIAKFVFDNVSFSDIGSSNNNIVFNVEIPMSLNPLLSFRFSNPEDSYKQFDVMRGMFADLMKRGQKWGDKLEHKVNKILGDKQAKKINYVHLHDDAFIIDQEPVGISVEIVLQ